MNGSAISKRLFNASAMRARSRGVKFGEGADTAIRAMSKKAAVDIVRFVEASGTPPEPLVRSAELVFEKLVDEMLSAQKHIPGYRALHPGVIGEQTLSAALDLLCPIWPLC